MGYDYTIIGATNTTEGYMSYNHGWTFRKYLDEDKGFRYLYSLKNADLIDALYKVEKAVIEENGGIPIHSEPFSDKAILNMDGKFVRDDGWATTYYNAYRCVHEILLMCLLAVHHGGTVEMYGD